MNPLTQVMGSWKQSDLDGTLMQMERSQRKLILEILSQGKRLRSAQQQTRHSAHDAPVTVASKCSNIGPLTGHTTEQQRRLQSARMETFLCFGPNFLDLLPHTLSAFVDLWGQ